MWVILWFSTSASFLQLLARRRFLRHLAAVITAGAVSGEATPSVAGTSGEDVAILS